MELYMAGKTVGAAVIILSAAGFGKSLVNQYNSRLRTLEQLRQMIYFLKGEMIYSQAHLAEALERVGKRSRSIPGKVFLAAAKRVEERDGAAFDVIWASEFEKEKAEMAMEEEDFFDLISLGKNLGYLDKGTQEQTILLYLDRLEERIEEMRRMQKEKNRLKMSLSVMSGLFLAIIMF